MALKDVVDLAFHFWLLAQEAPGRIRDKGRGVADFVNHHAFHNHLDALRGHAGNLQFSFIQGERQRADRLQAGKDQGALAGHNLEVHAGPGFQRSAGQAGDDQGLVGFRHFPHQLDGHPDETDHQDCPNNGGNQREEC